MRISRSNPQSPLISPENSGASISGVSLSLPLSISSSNSSSTPLQSPTLRRPTILIDLNGTLIYRTATVIEGAALTGIASKGRYVYPRPGAKEMLERLATCFRVYICTSMVLNNAQTALEAITTDWKLHIRGILDREFTKEDPNWKSNGGNHWDTIRDMQKIWSTIIPANETSTIFIDNEKRKCQECPRNCFVIPEAAVKEIMTNDTSCLREMTMLLLRIGETHMRTRTDMRLLLDIDLDISKLSLDNTLITPWDRVKQQLNCPLTDCTFICEHIDGDELVMNDLPHRLLALIKLPLPKGIRIERKIALSRLLSLNVDKSIILTHPQGDVVCVWKQV